MIQKIRDNIAIPAIGLGTWQVTGKDGVKAIKQAVEIGYRHIDTAKAYGNEQDVGKALQKSSVDRNDIHITTKVWRDALSYDDFHTAVDNSLERLETDYIDLLLVHWPNNDVPLKETMQALQEVSEQGKAKAIGVSNFTPALLKDARNYAPEIAVNQVEMHIYHQQKKMLEYCQDNNILVTAYSPLAQGRVTKDPVLSDIAANHDKTQAQVALRWLIQQDNVLAIPRAKNKQYQQQNLEAASFELTASEMDTIANITQQLKIIDPPFAPW